MRYTLKTPYRDGTTLVVFEPLDFNRAAAGAGAEAADPLDPLPPGVRAAQPVAG